MVDKITINDNELTEIFQNRINQLNNENRNSEIFIYNDQILKIYMNTDEMYKYNIDVIKELVNHYDSLKSIKELILPNSIILYNDRVVGYRMSYVKGITLEDAISNNLLTEEEMKIIFKKILKIIDKLKELSLDIFIGDLHEKNVIIDDKLNISIIDSDSFVINNHKLIVEGTPQIGKYPNNNYNDNALKIINISADYMSLLSMILNYMFKNAIMEKEKPLVYIKEHREFNSLKYLIKRVDKLNNFYLTEEDIDTLFVLKNTIKIRKDKKVEKRLIKEIKRIRNISNKKSL